MSKSKIPELTTEDIVDALEKADIETAKSYLARNEKMPVLEDGKIVFINPEDVLDSDHPLAAE